MSAGRVAPGIELYERPEGDVPMSSSAPQAEAASSAAARAMPQPPPPPPGAAEWAQCQHELTHTPACQWCSTCIDAKARDRTHRPRDRSIVGRGVPELRLGCGGLTDGHGEQNLARCRPKLGLLRPNLARPLPAVGRLRCETSAFRKEPQCFVMCVCAHQLEIGRL